MLILENIAKLVTNALGSADNLVDIPVGMAVDPVVYTAVGYKIA